jgi:hypothetical protein
VHPATCICTFSKRSEIGNHKVHVQELCESRTTAEELQAAHSVAEELQASQAVALSDTEHKANAAQSALMGRVRQVGELQDQLSATISERDNALECVASMQDQVRFHCACCVARLARCSSSVTR